MTDTERITHQVCDRYLSDPQRVLQAELEDQARFVNTYPLHNLGLKGPRRRLNYTVIFICAVCVAEVACFIYGCGYLDGFLGGKP